MTGNEGIVRNLDFGDGRIRLEGTEDGRWLFTLTSAEGSEAIADVSTDSLQQLKAVLDEPDYGLSPVTRTEREAADIDPEDRDYSGEGSL